jgi:hypothetical protein
MRGGFAMHREEWEQGTVCADCGAEIDPSRDPDYPFGVDSGDEYTLCGVCAARRGGVFDTGLDRWAVMPDLSDLTNALVTHRPHP